MSHISRNRRIKTKIERKWQVKIHLKFIWRAGISTEVCFLLRKYFSRSQVRFYVKVQEAEWVRWQAFDFLWFLFNFVCCKQCFCFCAVLRQQHLLLESWEMRKFSYKTFPRLRQCQSKFLPSKKMKNFKILPSQQDFFKLKWNVLNLLICLLEHNFFLSENFSQWKIQTISKTHRRSLSQMVNSAWQLNNRANLSRDIREICCAKWGEQLSVVSVLA